MKEYDIPTTIRNKFRDDKERHDIYCNGEGYIENVNKFNGTISEVKCPYCEKFNKDLFDDN